jgi:hypothetical protein
MQTGKNTRRIWIGGGEEESSAGEEDKSPVYTHLGGIAGSVRRAGLLIMSSSLLIGPSFGLLPHAYGSLVSWALSFVTFSQNPSSCRAVIFSTHFFVFLDLFLTTLVTRKSNYFIKIVFTLCTISQNKRERISLG